MAHNMKFPIFLAFLVPFALIFSSLIITATTNTKPINQKEASISGQLVSTKPTATPRIKTNTPEYITEKFYTDYLNCLKNSSSACTPTPVSTSSANINRNTNKNSITCSANTPQAVNITRVVGTTLTEAYVYLDETFNSPEDTTPIIVKTQKINNDWKIVSIICQS